MSAIWMRLRSETIVILAIPAVLLACNAVAALPARRAARTPAALVLRSE